MNRADLVNSRIIQAIHGKVNFGKKLFFNGFIPLTPEKQDGEEQAAAVPSADPSAPPTGSTPSNPTKSSSIPDTHIQPSSSEFKKDNLEAMILPSPGTIARRHSISLIDRTPPLNSLSAELIATESPCLLKTTYILNELKVMHEQFSDFGSCLSSLSSSESSDSVDETESLGGFQTLNEKKRIKRQKRKLRETPNKEEFLVKKPNLVDGI